jgi:MFS family permease
MVIVAAIATGSINALDVPTRQSFQVEMVGREDLMNAIALNSSVFNTAAIIGPSIAGVLIAAVGVPVCFLLNSVSYLAAIAALLAMRDLPAVAHRAEEQPLVSRLAVGVFSLFAMNRLTLMPLFADQVLHVGARGFGFLLASMGLGALTGALTLAFFPRLGSNPRRQLWMAAIWVAALLEFSVSGMFVVSLVTLFVAGYCQISFVATANNRIQTVTPDHLRGRVMALYAQALIGVGPIGALQAGTLATLFGAPWAMAIGAVIAGAVILTIRLSTPEVFGQPSQTSSPAATASAGTSHRSART